MRKLLIFKVLLFSLFFSSNLMAETIDYGYDSLGRLTTTIQGSTATVYSYDETGNVLAITQNTVSPTPPVINSILPQNALVGDKSVISTAGSNLLTTRSVSSVSGKSEIGRFTATDTGLSVEVAGISAGTDTLVVTTSYGTASFQITLLSSVLVISPMQLSLLPGRPINSLSPYHHLYLTPLRSLSLQATPELQQFLHWLRFRMVQVVSV